jgi:hypothetical protein
MLVDVELSGLNKRRIRGHRGEHVLLLDEAPNSSQVRIGGRSVVGCFDQVDLPPARDLAAVVGGNSPSRDDERKSNSRRATSRGWWRGTARRGLA